MDNENQFFNQRVDLSDLKATVAKIKTELGKIIIGQHHLIDLMITALFSDGHVLIEGVPGIAKTLTAKALARIIDSKFNRIQFTPDLMPSDLLGTSMYNLKNSRFEFHQGPLFTNLVLIDEVNRAPAKTQAALFEVMEERQITVDGQTYPMQEPYMVLATQNPIEQEGTYRLPEAQLDRFLFRIKINYPSENEEVSILKDFPQSRKVEKLNVFLDSASILSIREKVQTIHVEDDLRNYIVKMVQSTRNHPDLYLGASPRASIAVFLASKTFAAIQGRDFVTPEDIQFVFLPALNHRIILSPEREMEGSQPEDILNRIIEKTDVPR